MSNNPSVYGVVPRIVADARWRRGSSNKERTLRPSSCCWDTPSLTMFGRTFKWLKKAGSDICERAMIGAINALN
jgi:hypothetical protein